MFLILSSIINNDKESNDQILSDQESIHQSINGQMDGYSEEQKIYTDIVKANIGYDEYVEWIEFFGNGYMTVEELDDIVGMIVRAIVSRKPMERICGQDFPREVIKSAMLKVEKRALRMPLSR